jgi:hypothetical protein
MARYWLETRTRAGAFVAKIPFKNLQFEVGFNGPTGIRWESPLYHELITPSTISPGLHEVAVLRNGVVVRSGPIWDITSSTDSRSLNCSAQTLEDYLDKRLVRDASYVTTDQVNIAWDLIADSQALTSGSLGIVSGTLATGITRSIDYKTYDNKYILEAIQDFSELEDGFDFWIDPATRAFNAIYPRPQTNRNLHLVYPQHISSYAITYYGKYLSNRVVVQGPDPAYVVATDTTSLATYGLREYADALKDAATINDHTAYAGHVRDMRKDVKAYPTLVLRGQFLNIFDTSVIQYGDMFKVTIADGYTQVDDLFRYKGAQVTVNKNGDETIVIYTQDDREL